MAKFNKPIPASQIDLFIRVLTLPLDGLDTNIYQLPNGDLYTWVNDAWVSVAPKSNLVYAKKFDDFVEITGTTSPTILLSVELPKELLIDGWLEFDLLASRFAVNTAFTFVYSFLSTSAITNDQQMSLFLAGTNNLILNLSHKRKYIFKNNVLTHNSDTLNASDIDNYTGYGGSNNYTVKSTNLDLQTHNFLNIVVTPNNALQIIRFWGLILKIYKND